jgi:hypothetical protein
MMKAAFFLAAAILGAGAAPAFAQDANAPGLGEVVVTGSRTSARYAQQERPVVGLRRQADSAVLQLVIASDSRDAMTRTHEIRTMLLAALDRAAATGVELVTGNFELVPLTRANYQDLPLVLGGRVDTSQAIIMAKVKLAGSINAAELRLDAFIKSVPRTGRGTVDRIGLPTLTIVDPDQYRDAIVTLVAENARHYAAMFGPDYAVQVSGIDGQVAWSQVSGTDVFLYVPYHYTIVPK